MWLYRIAAIECRAVRLKCECTHDRKIAERSCGIHEGHGFLYAEHGLRAQQVNACIQKAGDMLLIDIQQLLIGHGAARSHHLAGSREIAGDQSASSDGFL